MSKKTKQKSNISNIIDIISKAQLIIIKTPDFINSLLKLWKYFQ
jgi:hypothetical protein